MSVSIVPIHELLIFRSHKQCDPIGLFRKRFREIFSFKNRANISWLFLSNVTFWLKLLWVLCRKFGLFLILTFGHTAHRRFHLQLPLNSRSSINFWARRSWSLWLRLHLHKLRLCNSMRFCVYRQMLLAFWPLFTELLIKSKFWCKTCAKFLSKCKIINCRNS